MTTDGVWVTYYYDNGPVLDRVHGAALDAYRVAHKDGSWMRVMFLPFNMDLSEAINAKKK